MTTISYQNGHHSYGQPEQKPSGLEGTHRAKAVEWALGTSQSGTEQIAVAFEILSDSHKGRKITWFGYFSEAALERTLSALRTCGWAESCDSIAELTGMGSAEVDLVIEDEVYEGKTRARIKWVNKVGAISLKNPMTHQQKLSLSERLRAAAIKSREGLFQAAPKAAYQRPPEPPPASFADSPESEDDIPF